MCIAESRWWFAFHDYKVEAQSQILERRLWEIFPKRCLTFWPYFLKDKDGLQDFLERDIPVRIETKMNGLGKFTTKINWLQAWVKVDWRGKIWCISKDGFMWLSEPGRPNENEAGKLIWKIPEQGNLPEEVNAEAPMFGVFKSPLSTEIIAGFLDEFKDYKWFKAAEEISWGRREGMNLFTLLLRNGSQKIDLFFQPEKYPGQQSGEDVQYYFDEAVKDGRDMVIDATYLTKAIMYAK